MGGAGGERGRGFRVMGGFRVLGRGGERAEKVPEKAAPRCGGIRATRAGTLSPDK